MPRNALSLHPAYTPILLLLVLSVLFFLPAVVRSDVLIYPAYSPFSDLTVIHWPYFDLLAHTYHNYGEIALWKDFSLGGTPLVANPLAMMAYPLTYFFTVLPINRVLLLLPIFHVFVSGVGLYLYVRLALGHGRSAAFLAAVLFMFSGKLMSHVAGGHVSLVAAMAWLPWIFLGVNRTVVRRSVAASVLTGLVVALQIVTHTQVFVYTAYALLVYSAFELWWVVRDRGAWRWRDLLRAAAVLVPIPLVAVTAGAAQLLPLLELAGYSNRAFSLAQASGFSLDFARVLAGVFLPDARVGHEYTIYPGLVTLGLAVLSLRHMHKQLVFFYALVVLALLLSLGSSGPLLPLLYRFAPGWQWMRASGRAWLFVSWALAVAASYGFEHVLQVPRTEGVSRVWKLFGVVCAAACLSLGAGLALGYGQVSRAVFALALLPSLIVGVVCLRRAGRLGPVALALSFTALGIADLWTFDYSMLAFRSSGEVFSERADVARYLRGQMENEEPFRIYSPSYSIPQHTAALYGLQMVDGVEPVHLARYDRFMAVAGGYHENGFAVAIPPFPEDVPLNRAFERAVPDPDWLGLLNTRYVVADFPVEAAGLTEERQFEGVHVYRNDQTLPRAFTVSRVHAVEDGEQAWVLMQGMDFRREAVVEGDVTWVGDGGFSGIREASVVLHLPNKVVTEIELPSPALLVLSENWYPGWTAYDNGRRIPILRTNYVLRGVELEAGHHTVTWVYQPPSWRWGARISGLALLLSAVTLAWWAWRRMVLARGDE